jgi:hypothetical protein
LSVQDPNEQYLVSALPPPALESFSHFTSSFIPGRLKIPGPFPVTAILAAVYIMQFESRLAVWERRIVNVSINPVLHVLEHAACVAEVEDLAGCELEEAPVVAVVAL